MSKGQLPPSVSVDDLLVRIRKAQANPNVGRITNTILRDGPQAFQIATLMEIIDPTSGDFHHYSLRIDQVDRKKTGWFARPERSVRLEGGEKDAIGALHKFLQAIDSKIFAAADGELHLISSPDFEKLANLIECVPKLPSADRVELLGSIASHLDDPEVDPVLLQQSLSHAKSGVLRQIAVAARITEYRNAITIAEALIEGNCNKESELQRFLSTHPWMFGSEYSELLDRRTWTRDDRQDFMLRRTVDGYLEIIEIKTPFPDPLLRDDQSHGSTYPSAALSATIGQVMRYIEEIERSRDQIRSKDGEDPLKIRGRIIIGRDGDDAQQHGLRLLNAHLTQIEILTFDQLLRIAKRVIGVFENQRNLDLPSPLVESDDIPF
ncbi:MAG: DUF4263 domain-containing protein [Phycisphaerales bacterium]|nr:DUF4263 domain-containing protein [Phycisphaerales bacterium]MCB9864848.1 DUF4263 domain-containing protein [Phycisphaerales bacterium]